MSEQTTPQRKSSAARTNGAAASPVTLSQSQDQMAGGEQLEQLAYGLWQARGCPEGSPEEDWFRAEQALNRVGAE